MSQENRKSLGRNFFCRVVLSAVAWAGLAEGLPLAAQPAPEPSVEGYITAIHPPDGFDLNGQHVTTTSKTGYGQVGATTIENDGPLRDAIEIGVWVQVFGERDRTKTVKAESVLFRDDRDRKLAGLGVIDRVISTAPELVFAADGYRIRTTAATEASYPEDVKSPAGVRTNLWVRYEGKLNEDGLLVASKARFLPAKPENIKAVKYVEETDWRFQAPQSSLSSQAAHDPARPPFDVSDQEATLTKDGSVKFGPIGRTYKIPADQALQSRVRRVGMSVVPAYQKQLPASDPSKIQFRFFAFDDDKAHSEICSFAGLILIPSQLVSRFKNDDQLAAVLADGVAFNLQRQAARIIEENRVLLGAETASLVAAEFVPLADIAYLVGSRAAASKIATAMEEQRARIAMQLMADAGYDPWQAPEAWRLAAPKTLPADVATLRYPDRAAYQLGLLHLMHKRPSSP